MAGSVNKAIILGNLGADPEVRTLQDGSKVVHLSVATSNRWKDKQSGEQRERTEWHRIVIWNEGLAGIADKYLKKGSKVYLEGAIQTRKWQGQDGQDRYTTEIVLQRYRGELALLSGPGNGGGSDELPSTTGGGAASKGKGGAAGIPELDDEIPFISFDELSIGTSRPGRGRPVF